MPAPFESYAARTRTFAAGDPVASADLNAIQDGIIATSENLDSLAEQLYSATGNGNSSDSPAPDGAGGVSIWVEKSSNGTNVVVLDNANDWRDRFVTVFGTRTSSANDRPGGSSDHLAQWSQADTPSQVVFGFFYTEAGQSGSSTPGTRGLPMIVPGGSEYVILFARNTDGALCIRKDAHAVNGDIHFMAKIEGSPVQNHY